MKFEKWITNKTDRPFYTRKRIEISKKISKAKAFVCGLGQFNFYINGNKVEDHILDPGWTDYNKLIEYVTFDVTGCLNNGENILAAEVGNGWFIKNDDHYTFHFPEFMPPNPNPYKPFGKYLVFAMKLVITYEDGSAEEIIADESFKVKEHMVQASNVYGSELIDGTKRIIGWNEKECKDENWENASVVEACEEPKGRLIDQFQPPIRVIKTYEGSYLHTVNNRKIYDFSQNMSGMLELEIKGKAGDKIFIYPAEKLNTEGDADQMAKNWMMIDNCITYIIGEDDKWEKCESVFAYFAGRYIAVEGEAEIRNVRANAITSATKRAGTFTCDDERFNKIYDLVEKAVEANMLSVHTDCPTIERFAWQEPNHLMAPSIMYMKDGKLLWEKFLLDMRVGQHSADDYFYDFEGNKFYPGDGLMPAQAPCYIPNVLPVPGMGSFYDIIPWGSTCILGTYWHYMFYGDKKIIEDNYDAGMRYLNHLKTKINEDGFINHGLGDWGNPRNELSRENVETAFLYADATVLSKFADILGRPDDREKLNTFAEEVRANYNEKLLVRHEDGFFCYKSWDHPDEIFLTQAAQALPLYWGMVPKEKEEDIAKALLYTLKRDGSFVCGEVGQPYVIQCAKRFGMNDLIVKYILKEGHPSYYAFVLDGETTLGEYWENNPRSHCHDMMGHIVEWYYNGIAGIEPLEPGFKKVRIRPYMPQSMNEFKCTYICPYGEISVAAKRIGADLDLKVSVPDGVEYTVDRTNCFSCK
jgi:hypothetical protein